MCGSQLSGTLFTMCLTFFPLVVIDAEVFSLSPKVSILLQNAVIFVDQSEINQEDKICSSRKAAS